MNRTKKTTIQPVSMETFGVLPLMTVSTIKILKPGDVIDNDEKKGGDKRNRTQLATVPAVAAGSKRKLVFSSQEKMLTEKKVSHRTVRLDELRTTIVVAEPSAMTLVEGHVLYERYLNELESYVESNGFRNRFEEEEEEEEEEEKEKEKEKEKEENEKPFVFVESWRSFRWNKVSLTFVSFERCCVAFNVACYRLSIFKQWFQNNLARWAVLDLSSITERIKSNYVKQKKTTIESNSSSVSSSFHLRERPNGFEETLIEDVKRNALKLKDLAYDFRVLSKKGFPTSGTWSSELIGVCDANLCEDFARSCLCYCMMLNHVLLDKTYHGYPASKTQILGYDGYKSAILLCHYKEIVNVLQPTITGHVVSSTSSYSPIKHYVLLVLIMCYVRYVCDDDTTTSMLKKTGELLSVYNYLENYLTPFASNDAPSRFQQHKLLMSELLKHVKECRPALSLYNERVAHNRVNSEIDIAELIENIIPDRINDLSIQHQIRIPESWIPKFSPPSIATTAPAKQDRSRSYPSVKETTTTNPSSPSKNIYSMESTTDSKKRNFVTYACLSYLKEETRIPDDRLLMKAKECGLIDLTIEEIHAIVSEELSRIKTHLFGSSQ
jgi:hypothetical protein